MIIWRMRIVYWIPKATNTHSEYVILIAFPLQQRLQERAPLLRYTERALPVLLDVKYSNISVVAEIIIPVGCSHLFLAATDCL
jgi:hypothetical protein